MEALRTIAVAAYQHYVSRIGQAPAPMTADYPQAVRCRQAWVAVEGGEYPGTGTSRPTGPSETASAVCTSANRCTDLGFLVMRESHMCAGN